MKQHIALCLALFMLLTLTGCAQHSDMEIPELLEPVAAQMDVAEAVYDTIFEATLYEGEIVPHIEQVQFSVDGTLDAFLVSIGEYVTQGQELVALREDSLRTQMETLEEEKAYISQLGNLSDRQLQAEIAIAEAELKQLQALGAMAYECSLKELDIEKLEEELEQAQELRSLQIQELNRKWEQLNSKLEQSRIYAPCSGRVVYVASMRSGSSVQPFTTVLCIADESRLKLQTDYMLEPVISGADKVFAKVGDKELPVEYIPYDSEELFFLTLSGGDMYSYFNLGVNSKLVKSGQYAVLMLLDPYREHVLTIPANALQRSGTIQYVYKMVDGQWVRCDVTVGIVTDTKAEIREGLQEGDLVYVKT